MSWTARGTASARSPSPRIPAPSSATISPANSRPEVAADTTPPDYTVQETDHDNLYDPAAEPSPVRQEDAADTEDTQGLHIGHRIKHAFIAAGISLKNFFTGGNSSDR